MGRLGERETNTRGVVRVVRCATKRELETIEKTMGKKIKKAKIRCNIEKDTEVKEKVSGEKSASEKEGSVGEKDSEGERNVSAMVTREECGQKQAGMNENKDVRKEDREKESRERETETEMREEEESTGSDISAGEITRREIRKRNLQSYRMVRTRKGLKYEEDLSETEKKQLQEEESKYDRHT